MKIIAIEEHIHTEDYIAYLYSRKEYPRRDFTEEGGKKFIRDWWTPTKYRLMDPDQPNKLTDLGEGRIKEMDEAGIDMQVLSLSFPGVELFDAADGVDIAKKVNNNISEIINRYPERFAGFAALAAQAPEEASGELERAVNELGLKGAMINGNIQGEFLDDPKYWVIFEMAEKLDVPIYIHPKMPPADMIKPYLAYPGLAAALSGFAAEASLHAIRLICSGVFDKHPDLKIILGHLGEAIPFWLWRLDSRLEEEKGDPASAEIYRHLKKNPSQYFKDNFFVTTSGMFWEPVVKFTCSVLGLDKVLFAADYPYESSKKAVDFIDTMSMNDGDKAQICYKNAEKLLKL
ncbi:amidohydrolase family protein [Thermodesulfobacteriota bacterium]